jgi:hypothetical protein
MDATDRDSVERWVASLEDLDREVARLALSCRLDVLDSRVIDCVLLGDDSVCGCDNPSAFSRLQGMLKLHFAVRRKAGEALGQPQAAEVETFVINNLRQAFPGLEIRWPTGRA